MANHRLEEESVPKNETIFGDKPMKILPYSLFLLLSGLIAGAVMTDDEGRRADILDAKGVTTFVRGLHYCCEEDVEGEVYISKYDNFFVRRGEAEISVRLDSLAEVEFTGKVEEAGAERLYEARIKTRRGSETVAFIVCHSGGFIKGRVELGEYRLSLDRVRKMTFTAGEGGAWSGVRCLFPEEDAGHGDTEGAVVLVLNESGLLLRDGVEFEDFDDEAPPRVFLKVSDGSSCSSLKRSLERLAECGVSEVVFSP
jgi:hypothetical protein